MSKNTNNTDKANLEADGYNANAKDGDGDGMVQDGTKFERPEGYDIAAVDGDGDGTVQDGTEFERPAGTEAPDIAAQLASGKPKSKTKPSGEEAATHVISGKGYDDVFLRACVYKNQFAQKSLTIHHLQRRLMDLGFVDAFADVDGWYGDLTKKSVEEFQVANKIAATGLMDKQTFVAIFDGDPNVRVNL